MTDTTKAVADWNVKDFHTYMQAEHKRLFGVAYRPQAGWGREQKLLGDLIGTARKPGTASKAQVKAFIDECFASYRPTAAYPGTNFGWLWQYRANVWQRLELEALQARGRNDVDEDNAEWF
jgi:hypothetical protein